MKGKAVSSGKHARLQALSGAARRRPKAFAGLTVAAVAGIVLGANFVISAAGAGAATGQSGPGTLPAHAARGQFRPQASANATSGLTPFTTVAGKVYMSEDGIGTNDAAGGPVLVQKRDASATVQAAYLLAAGIPGYTIQNGDITLNGTSLSFPAANTVTANDINSVWTDVTSIVKPVVDAAAAGNVSFTAAEGEESSNIDGEILAVIMQDPTMTTDNTVSFEFGALNPTGDNYSIGLAQPLNLSNQNLALTMSIGDSYSYQGAGQYSDITVNGTKLTSSAGGNDDSACKFDNPQDFTNCGNGELITVGGIGDSTANPPDPNATDETCASPGPPRCDDELYNLLPFVHNGDTSILVNTDNPSNDDNIFFTGFELDSAVAVVGAGATLSPASGTGSLGTPYTLTTKVQDSTGKPVASQAVTFTVLSGPDADTTHSATTDSTGSATFTYTGASAGEDVVQASFTDPATGAKEVSNTATVDWTAGATATTVKTSLSGGGKSGPSITVPSNVAVTDTATLAGTNASAATGTVTYTVYSNSACTTVAATAGTVQVADGVVPASPAVALKTVGTYYWKAAYSGDSLNKASVSTCGTSGEIQTVTPGTSITTKLLGDSLSGTSLTLPAGQPATDSAVLSGMNAAKATGGVTYRVYSDAKCTTLVATAGTAKVIGGKVGNSAPEVLAAGTYYWRASYSGDGANSPSTSACGAEVLTVKKPAGTPGTAPAIDSETTAWHTTSTTAHAYTNLTGDLVVAFVAANGPATARQTATVSGGGLTWYLISRQNPAGSDTEVWVAIASGKLTNATITVTGGIAGYDEVVTLVAFRNASGVGPEAFASASSGAPHASLTTATANSWVFAVGADWHRYAARTPGSGQRVLSTVNAGGHTVWIQALSAATPAAGTAVTINDTAPTADPYALMLVGIQ